MHDYAAIFAHDGHSWFDQVMSVRSYLQVERTRTPPQSHKYQWETLSPEFTSWGRVGDIVRLFYLQQKMLIACAKYDSIVI